MHHLFQIDAHLDAGICLACLLLCGICHHLLPVPLGNRHHLDAHVGFVDGADIVNFTAQLPDDEIGIAGKVADHRLRFPAALADEPQGAGKMVQRHDGLDAVCLAAGNYPTVVLHLVLIEFSFFRLDSRPLDAEPVGIQSRLSHQPDVLFIAVIVVAGFPAGFREAGMGHMLLGPVVAAYVIALNLMCCGCRTDEKAFGKLHGNALLIF